MQHNTHKFLAGFFIFPGLLNMLTPGVVPGSSKGTDVTMGRGGTVPILARASTEGQDAGLPLADDREPRKTIWVLATAYTSSPDETDDTPFTTASGTTTRPGTVAANFMYFGSRVRIPEYFGDMNFTIEDRMNERYGEGRIDIWMPTKAQARDWGARWVKMGLY